LETPIFHSLSTFPISCFEVEEDAHFIRIGFAGGELPNIGCYLFWKPGWSSNYNISAIEGDEGHEGNEEVESHKNS